MEVSARTVVSRQRLNKRNTLLYPCGAVAALRLAVAMEHERTYLVARTSGKTTARPPTSLPVPFQASANVMDLDYKIFDSDGLITEVEKRPALYNIRRHQNTATNTAKKTFG